MTITLQWWWCLPLVIAAITFVRDIAGGYCNDYPWTFWGFPLAAGLLTGHYL